MAALWQAVFGDCSKVSKFLKNKERVIFGLTSLVLSTLFTYKYFLYTNEYPPGSYERISSYEADKVFQTRLLVTTIANLLIPIIPFLETSFQWIVPYPINYEVLLQLITALSTTILLLSIPKFLELLGTKINPWSSLLILVLLFWNYIAINGMIDGAGLYYPYDLPSLTFFSIGVILFCRSKWILYYPVYILALLNRESSCFIPLTGFFLIAPSFRTPIINWFKKNRILIVHILAQTMLWLISRVGLSWYFRDNPGSFFEEPHSAFEFFSAMINGQGHWAMSQPIWFLSIFCGIWIFPLIFFRKMNHVERRLSIVGLIYIVSLFFRSNMMETRVYNELNVILFAIVLSLISRFYSNYSVR